MDASAKLNEQAERKITRFYLVVKAPYRQSVIVKFHHLKGNTRKLNKYGRKKTKVVSTTLKKQKLTQIRRTQHDKKKKAAYMLVFFIRNTYCRLRFPPQGLFPSCQKC